MPAEFRSGRCKLLHLEWISNEVLKYSTGNYIQSVGMNMMEDSTRKNCVCVCVCVCVCETGSRCHIAEIAITL